MNKRTPKIYSAKVGTVPMLIHLQRHYALTPGQWIQWRLAEHGTKWETGIVDKTDPILFITRL